MHIPREFKGNLNNLAGQTLAGDVGILFSDPGGTRTVLRSYWSNQDTGITADVPSEARLQPANWGLLQFE